MDIKLPAIDFYGFVGVIVPGTLLLVGIDYLFQIEKLGPLLIPDNFGALGAHLILAYLVGHLLQSLGNGIEWIYWRFWRGMPTDWPISRTRRKVYTEAINSICQLTKQDEPNGNLNEKLGEWRRLVSQTRSTIYATGRATRLQIFNGNYGMFRGVLAALLVIALIGWLSTEIKPIQLYAVLTGLFVLALVRMHRFAVHYANELFANAAEIARLGGEKNAA